MDSEGGSLALAWGLLALKALNEPAGDFSVQLTSRQQEDGSWNGNAYHTGVALLADGGQLWPSN